MPSEKEKFIPGKIRTERNIKWIALRKELNDLGYATMPMILDKWQMYRVAIILINHLAFILKKNPTRVYQSALSRAFRVIRGQPHVPGRQAQAQQDGLSDADRAHGLSVLCPRCGQELLDCGKETKAEVLQSIKMKKQIPRKSPQKE